jgi:hypothetical protein
MQTPCREVNRKTAEALPMTGRIVRRPRPGHCRLIRSHGRRVAAGTWNQEPSSGTHHFRPSVRSFPASDFFMNAR